MFTGLVDDVGTIVHVATTAAGREFRVQCRYADLADGESVAMNGACLTVRTHGVDNVAGVWFTVAAVSTTLDRTMIASWDVGSRINLERAMRLGDRLGGHLVQGHVDGVGRITAMSVRDDAWLIDVTVPEVLRSLMVLHGSVTIDGVSLTVNALHDDGIQLSIIEFTRRHTTLGDALVGLHVHVEADMIAKHVERLVTPHRASLSVQ